MLRVLTLSTLFPDASRPGFGGFVERQTRALAARPDVEVAVLAPIGLPPFPLRRHPRYRDLAALPAREAWNGLDVRRQRFLNLPGTGGRHHGAMLARAALPALGRLREQWRFDVIDAEFFFPDGPAAVALGKALGVPVSIKARGSDVHVWGRAKATAAQVIAAGRGAGGLLAVSEAMARDMIALGLPAERIRVHRTGVDPAFGALDRAAARASLGVTRPLVLSVGALTPNKGHEVVIRAMTRLEQAQLWIAGEGPERARLAALIDSLGLGGRVRLLGNRPHAELPTLHAAASVFALASASEGLANVWVEALASGTPVVTTDVGGAREVVTGEVGRLVARTPDAFAAGLGEMLEAGPPAAWVKAAVAGYSWDANAVALEGHLRGLVTAHQANASPRT